MIAVDTNILVYAHRIDSPFHEKADHWLTELAEEGDWAIPWPCLHEFLAVVTHPRVYKPPTPLPDAIKQVECWIESPRLELIGESDYCWPLLKGILESGKFSGARVHDARIIAICRQYGIQTLWSADRDFSRVEGIEIKNPLIS